MKKILLLSIALTLALNAQSQVLFYESFDNILGNTAGGQGTFVFPNGWLLANVDTLTTNAAVSFVTNAWTRNSDYVNHPTDTAAFSTSWYNPQGQADDWMVTPAVGPLPAAATLSWRGLAYDTFAADGYEVRVMTTPPIGGTGNIGNLVDSSVVLLNVTAENSAWTTHTISLNAYAGQTIYIAFRNHSIDKDLLLIDDVKIESYQNDAKLISIDTASEYTMIPQSQVYSIPTLATLINNGANTLTNVALKLNVYNSSNSLIYSNTGSAIASLDYGVSAQVSAGNYLIPAISDNYTFEYIITHSVQDDNPANDTLYDYLVVDDSTYARDNGTIESTLGFSAGTTGYIGQQFTLNTSASVSSVTFYAGESFTGKKVTCVLWNMSAGIPDSIIASTDTLTYPDGLARYYTLPINGGAYTLSAGTYTITCVQLDTILAVGQAQSKFTYGTEWINHPTSPLGTWANVESFGASYQTTSMIRLNLNPNCATFSANFTVVNASCSACADGSLTAIPNGVGPFTYVWSNGGTTATISNLVTGVYTVTVTGGGGCFATAMDSVSFTSGIPDNKMAMSTIVYPNPANGLFTVIIPQDFVLPAIQVVNQFGQIVYTKTTVAAGIKNVDLTNLASGKYVMTISNDKYIINKCVTIIK